MNKLRIKPKDLHLKQKAGHEPKEKEKLSFLPIMKEGREYESIINFLGTRQGLATNISPIQDLLDLIPLIEQVRGRPLICYLSNVINNQLNAPISIDQQDELPFAEMISAIPKNIVDVDVMLVTPGGSGPQVAKFVDKLRPRFNSVSFILPNIAMSAGTIFAMSGNDIIMTKSAYIGPIDPQVPGRDGQFVPAQSILTLIDEIKDRGEKKIQAGKTPDWTDLQILRMIDAKEIGNAQNASNFSVEMVERYLKEYKFKFWNTHSDGGEVTDDQKSSRANEIAAQLCKHSLWKSHSRGITREDAWNLLRLKITKSEDIEGLDQLLSKFWAVLYFAFESSTTYKMYISSNYTILRHHNLQK